MTVRIGGYWASVESAQYTRVVLTFDDGNTAAFSGDYSDRTTFAHSSFRGEERTSENNPADEVYEQFNGRISAVTVESSEGSTTVENPVPSAPTGVQIDCSNVILDGEDIFLAGFHLEFTDGSRKEFSEGDFGSTITIGSGGRRVETAYLEVYDDQSDAIGWFAFSNPAPECTPREPTTSFDCTEVEVTPAEIVSETTVQERPVTLFFADGTEQEISEPDIDLPRTFTGQGENSGKIIEAIGITRRDWGSYYYLVNPDVEECANSQPEFSVTFDCYAVVVSGDAYDRVELQTAAGSETLEGEFGGETRFGFFGENRLRDQDAPNRTYREFSGPIVSMEVFDGDSSQVFEADSVDECWAPSLQIGCSSVSFDQQPDGDFRARFPNAYKRWDGPRDGIQEFGSPGRTLRSFDAGGRGLLLFNEPDRSCDSDSDRASAFDCTTFTIQPAEFIDSEPTFDSVQLTFTDGSSQDIGLDSDPEAYTAPETFAGSDEHEGKVIQKATVYTNGGDTFFEFINPDAASCGGGASADQPVEDGAADSPTGESGTSRELSNAETVGRVTLDGTEYLVLRQLPDASSDVYAFVDADYELLEPGRATDVAISYIWMNSYNVDSRDRLTYTNRQYERFRNVERMGEVADVLSEIRGTVSLATLSPDGAVREAATGLGAAVEWQINEIRDPYEEQCTRMAACGGTLVWIDESVSEPAGSLTDADDDVTEVCQTMLDCAGEVQTVNDVASTAAAVRDILQQADPIRDTVADVTSVETLTEASYTVLGSIEIDTGVPSETTIVDSLPKTGALGAGNAAVRRPLLAEIIGLEQRIADGTLGPTGILRLQALRQTEYQLEATALRAMSAYQSTLASGLLGDGFVVLFNTDQLAAEFASAAASWLDLSHYTVAQTGIAFDRALQRYENSLNYQEFGDQNLLTRP